MKSHAFVIVVAAALAAGNVRSAQEGQTDIVIYGGTSAGIAAAVQAARMGVSAVVVSPDARIGGLTTGGLGQTDIGNKAAIGGIAREFYRAVKAHYSDNASWKYEKRGDYKGPKWEESFWAEDAMWTFEPKVALAILEGWVKRDGIRVVRGERLDRGGGGVVKKTGRIVAIRMESGRVFEGRMFIDATYEGDLMAAAGVPYHVGRESNSVYGETLNGCQPSLPSSNNHNFRPGVSAYVKPGDPSSGILPGIEKGPIEPVGTGDRRVQAYCFRSCLTDDPRNRIPFKKPEGYDERDYELLFRNLAAGESWRVMGNCKQPNRKTDTNNNLGTSLDFIGANWDYPEASYEEREKIVAAHLKYQQGLFWTLANHPRVPKAVRDECSRWGTCRDEFEDGFGDGWQRQLYVREARRMVGEFVMTEHHCTHERKAPRPIALAAYTMDSHHVRRYVTPDGLVRNEGNVEVGVSMGPYPIDYGAILPKKSDCANLLVPVCLSASHIAYGSIRMEPVFFELGQAAATAAALAAADGRAVQDVDYGKLAARLVADGQRISYPSAKVSRGRKVIDLSGRGWTLDGSRVEVPHTWNAFDGADGVGEPNEDSVSAKSYARRRGVYRRGIPAAPRGRRTFVRCLGASQKAVVRVNGVEIGRHVGAFTAFCFEATKWMKDSDNLLEIEVDNLVDGDVPPVQADFTVFGGLYRGVELIETERICIDCVTDGASGVCIEADPDTGAVVAHVSVDGGTNEVRRFSFPNPRLWSPESPALYKVDVTVAQDGCTDTVTETFGFRRAEFRDDGFYLNGMKRKIRGVNMHQDVAARGWAVSRERHARDIALMKEMGADGLRTAHYPHASATYDECDRQGLLVWCEYPNVNNFGVTETYRKAALRGVREMIAQLRNHPSIVIWSVANEYRTNSVVSHAWLSRVLGDLVAEARRLDSGRAVAAATCRSFLADVNTIPDVLGFNFYPGWYRREADEMKETIDAALADTRRASIGVTEYGAGGNIDSHNSPEIRNAPLSPFHSEEYQAWVHRFNYQTLRDDPRVWGSFVWAMFDFAADARREGSQFGMNDKGLVCYDHETRKDAFWFYKANWTDEPLLHLVGRRMSATTNASVTVLAFWNGGGEVTLKVNGEVVGSLAADSAKTVIWRGVALRPGGNEVEVAAGGLSEKATWRRLVPSEPSGVPPLMAPGTTRAEWESSRRPELVKTALEAEYGERPVERPADLAFSETAPAEECFGGTAIRRRVRATYSGPGGEGKIDFSVWIPKRRGKAPVFIHSSPRPAETAADPDAPRPIYLLPAEMIVRRGFAAVAYCNQDVSYDAWEGPEFHDRGVFSIYGPSHLDSRSPREWGILSAWAWGVSRIVDWVETEPLLDAAKVAVVGLSRNGKAAIVAGATDPRIALTVSCCSGCGGAKLNHMDLPFSESIDRIYPHHRWFARGFFDWRGRDMELPWDQHQILALVAPRLLYVSSAESDVWAGPDGEFHSARLASPAWGLYGRKGIAQDARPPRLNEPMHDGAVGYHRRAGRHAILAYDWERYMDFAERNGWK